MGCVSKLPLMSCGSKGCADNQRRRHTYPTISWFTRILVFRYTAWKSQVSQSAKMFGSEYIRRKFLNAVQSVNQNVSTLYDWLKQLAYFFTTVVTIFWLSVFFYGTLYYYYVPVVSREKPVYFRFRYILYGIYEVLWAGYFETYGFH